MINLLHVLNWLSARRRAPVARLGGSERMLLGGAAAVVFAALLVAVPDPASAGPAAATSPSCASEAPDATAAAAMAKLCGTRVEVLTGRSERTQVFANPDETSTFEATAVPARVHRVDGSWVAVDTSLHTRADGSLAPVATLADVVFSGGGSGPFVTYRVSGLTLTVSWPTVLPTASVAGATATYAEVLPGIDLRVTATAAGFRHVLVVKSAQAAANQALTRIRYQVGGDVVARMTPDGRVRFVDKTGHTVAMTSGASMWDSRIDAPMAGEVLPGVDLTAVRSNPPTELRSSSDGPGAASASAPLGVSSDGGNGLVLTPDPKLLTGSDTVYPVFIDPQIGAQRTRWAYANSINSNWDVNGEAWVGRNPFDGTLYRSFFDFPTTYGGQTYKGKHVLKASFSIMLDHSWSCSDTWAHLYRTGAITVSNGARMSWGTRPLGSGAKWLDSAAGHANEAGGCGSIQPDMLMTFGNTETMRADVQAAANGGWNTYTAGICACNSAGDYESSQDRWKRFHIDSNTTMSVTYNTVPGTPANLSPHQGQVACGGFVGTTSPVLQAQYVDADGSDTLSATFNWQQLPSGTVNSVAGTTKPANNNGTATLSLGSSAEGKAYQFQVRTYDGHDYSPWSPWCAFTVDATAPPAPVVTPTTSGSAPVYVMCDPGSISSCTARGGPGVAGAFMFSEPSGTAGQDVVKYVYGWDSPSVTVTLSSPGASYGPVLLTPPHYGLNTLTVYSRDGSGKQSGTTSFRFLVGGPSSPLAYWPLDTINGHNFTDQVSGASLTASGITWTGDARYIGTSDLPANAATFSSSSEATQSVPAFDTSGSFSVAAWTRLSSTACSGNRTAVSIDGDAAAAASHASGLFLSYDCTTTKWRMRIPDRNVAAPSMAEAVSASAAVAGQWTFLVGVWDENERKVRLYVNGSLSAQTTPTSTWLSARGTGWKATGSVVLGRDRWNDSNGGRFAGEIADVRLWNRVITVDDLSGTDEDPTNGVPAQVGLTSPLQVGSWNFADAADCFCTDSLDGGYFQRRLFLDAGWTGDPSTSPSWFTADSHDLAGGGLLLQTGGYASTTDSADGVAHPVLRTDQSFTVSAWVRMDRADQYQMVLAQDGPVSSGFYLYYAPDNGGTWKFKIFPSVTSLDNTNSTIAQALAPDATTSWHHLVAVLDAGSRQITLYVDGDVMATSALNAAWQPWQATGSLTVGRAITGGGFANFLAGTIDQVQVWQGVLNAREIKNLHDNT